MKKEQESKYIYYLCLIGFFAIFSTTISKNPVLSLYTHALGGNEFIIGLIAAISPLAGILFSFPVGILSDKIGRKKLLITSAIVFLISPLLYTFVMNPYWLIPIRFFHGLGTAILGPVVSAIIVEKYQKNKGEKLGIYNSSTLVGRTLAPLLGGFLISYFFNPGIAIVSYKIVYFAAFLISLPVFFLVLFLENDNKKSKTKLNFKSNFKYLFKKNIFSTGLIQMSVYFAFGSFETYLPVYLSDLNISASLIGLIFSLQILSIALSQPIFGKLADKIDKRKQILAGILILGLSISLIGFFSSIISIIILGLIFAIGLSLTTIATNSYIAEIAKKDKLGTSLGALSSIMDIGHSIGPLLTGIIITYFSYKLGFIASLILCLITAIIFYINNKK